MSLKARKMDGEQGGLPSNQKMAKLMEVDSSANKTTDTASGSASSSVSGSEIKPEPDPDENCVKLEHQKRSGVNFKLETILPENGIELLGSVVVSGISDSGPQQPVRSSARVIQKMRMDSSTVRPATPPLKDDKKTGMEKVDSSNLPKTPTNSKMANKVLWNNAERALFFEALNEYGKDFEAITQHINQKMKKKIGSETKVKTRDQIRQLYIQTFHKVSKYLKFSEDVKRVAQELYALINYGEMRRKLLFVHEKVCMKLKELIYKGSVTVREKGKTIRIKTPSCRALRKLNQLEEWQEEITLPQRVEVTLVPATMEAWGRVHSLAQNPRVKTVFPLQKRVSGLIKFLQNKWRSQELRLCEKTMSMQNAPQPNTKSAKSSSVHSNKLIDPSLLPQLQSQEPLLCLAPPPKTIIHRPMVNLTDFSNSYSICLNSYEERIGAKIRGETLNAEKLQNLREKITANKRQRHDSGSDKKGTIEKRAKGDGANVSDGEVKVEPAIKEEESIGVRSDILMLDFTAITENDEVVVEKFEVFSDNSEDKKMAQPKSDTENAEVPEAQTKTSVKKKDCQKSGSNKGSFKPLINEDLIKKIKEGWTINNCGDLTFGDLYVMFGQEFKINLEYRWTESGDNPEPSSATNGTKETTKPVDDNKHLDNLIGRRLNQLLMIASMEKTKRKHHCSCGHICDKGIRIRDNENKMPFMNDNNLFKHPALPARSSPVNSYSFMNGPRPQNMLRRLKVRQNRLIFSSKQVVHRILPLHPNDKLAYLPAMDDDGDGDVEEDAEEGNSSKSSALTSKTLTLKTSSMPRINNMLKSQLKPSITKEVDNKKSVKNSTEEPNLEEDDLANNPGIQSLMDISLPSLKFGEDSRLLDSGEGKQLWLEENINDYSFSSLLGHLDSHFNEENRPKTSEIDFNKNNNANRQNDLLFSDRCSVISESSVDYVNKFAELAESLTATTQEN